MRGLDLFVTRRKLAAFDVRIRDLDAETIQLDATLAARQADVANGEKATAAIHEQILQAEHQIGNLTQSAAQADSLLVRAQEVTRVNEQRIAEYREWAERDTREISATREQIGTLRGQLTGLKARETELHAQRDAARAALQTAQVQYEEHRQAVDLARGDVQRLRGEAVERERRAATIQNQLSAMETRQRETLIQRERLSSEHAQLARALELVASTQNEVQIQLDLRAQDVSTHETRIQAIESERSAIAAEILSSQDDLSRLQSQMAARRAQVDLLSDSDETAGEFLEGARQLLDPNNALHVDPATVLGALVEKLTVPQDLRLAVEATLRAWIDAVVVRNAADARTLVDTLLGQGRQMAARLVVADGPDVRQPPCPAGLQPLLQQVQVAPEFAAAASRLLGNVFLAPTPADVPHPLPDGCTVVTRNGAVFHANGCVEVWMPDRAVSSPLARRMLIADGTTQLAQQEQELTVVRSRLEERRARSSALAAALIDARRACDEVRRQAAHKEGELQTVARDATRARQRLDVVAHELETLNLSTREDDERRSAWSAELQQLTATRGTLVETIATRSEELQALESAFGARNTALTEARIQASAVPQQCEHTASQVEAVTVRLAELERTLEGRNQGVQSYDEGISRLAAENVELAGRLDDMRREAADFHAQVDVARKARAATARELEQAEAQLAGHRQMLDASRTRKAAADVELAESRMHRQNQFDRIGNEYSLSPAQLVAEPDPAWPGGEPPAIEDAETRIAQLNGEIHEMGPVNWSNPKARSWI